jgi:hypothetical protein
VANDLMPLEERIEQAMHSYGLAMDEAAEARAEAENLDALLKHKKAVLFLKYKSGGESAATAEQMALADPVYAEDLANWMAANLRYRRLAAEESKREKAFEAWRTASSNKRAEMNLR